MGGGEMGGEAGTEMNIINWTTASSTNGYAAMKNRYSQISQTELLIVGVLICNGTGIRRRFLATRM